MHVIKMIGSRYGTEQNSIVVVCKNMVKSTPNKPMKKPKAKSIPFLDLNKAQETIIDAIVNPKIDAGDAKNKKTRLMISDFSSYLNCQASMRIPAVTEKILVMIKQKQIDSLVAGLPRISGF